MKIKKIPSRICVGCGEAKEKKEMLRIVKDGNEQLSLDVTGKKNGRGAYLCKNSECFEKAIKRKGLERSLKMRLPDEMLEQIKKEMSAFEAGSGSVHAGNGS